MNGIFSHTYIIPVVYFTLFWLLSRCGPLFIFNLIRASAWIIIYYSNCRHQSKWFPQCLPQWIFLYYSDFIESSCWSYPFHKNTNRSRWWDLFLFSLCARPNDKSLHCFIDALGLIGNNFPISLIQMLQFIFASNLKIITSCC